VTTPLSVGLSMLCSSELLGKTLKLLQESYTNTNFQLSGQEIAANPQTLLKLAIQMYKVHIHQFPFIRANPQTSWHVWQQCWRLRVQEPV